MIGLYLPLFVVLLGDAHVGIAFQKLAVHGVTVAGAMFNIFRRHPSGGALINYDMVLLLVPLQLIGTMIGVVIYNSL